MVLQAHGGADVAVGLAVSDQSCLDQPGEGRPNGPAEIPPGRSVAYDHGVARGDVQV